MVISSRPPVKAPSLPEWEALIKPEPGQGESVVLGARADEPLPRSIADVRQQVARLDYQNLDPYVASVAGSIAARQWLPGDCNNVAGGRQHSRTSRPVTGGPQQCYR